MAITTPPDGSSQKRQLTAVKVALARRDPNHFCEFVMRTPEGLPWVQQPFHRQWQDMIPREGPARKEIVAFRGSAKSSQLAVARPLWELGHNPNLRVKIITNTDDLAIKLVSEIRQHIDSNPRLHAVFPRLQAAPGGPWAQGKLLVVRPGLMKDPSVEACGVLTSTVGGRADLIIFDDVCDQLNTVIHPTLRGQVKLVVFGTLISLLGPEGRAVYVATPWHRDDLTCALRTNPQWQVWWQPAINPETGALLWGEKWTREALEARRQEIGDRAFSQQFLLQPLSDEDATFQERVIQACLTDRWAPGEVEVEESWPRFIGVDLGSSLKAKASYTVAFVITLGTDDKRYPLEIVQKRLQFDETVELIADLWVKYSPAEIRVENNAYQEAIVQHLKQRFPGMPVAGQTTGRQKADEKIGLPGLATTMANGGWVIPAGGEPHAVYCECAWCAWVSELRAHPLGRYSDIVMAMWFAEAAAREYGRESFAANFVIDWGREPS